MHIFASWPYLSGGGVCKFSQTEEEEEEEEEPEFDSSGDEIPYVKRSGSPCGSRRC